MNQINNLPYLKEKRRSLRNNLTPAEAKLWNALKNSKLAEIKFRRQHSIGNYIVDFYCPKYLLAIELDGQIHFNSVNIERDKKRTEYLNNLGIVVVRFENEKIFQQLNLVLEEIKQNCSNKRF